MRVAAVAAALLLLAAAPAAPERLADPAQEARAHTLFRQVRCVVCQNESIDDSDAPLAADLRGLVRQQVLAGRDDVQIKRFLTDRYGDFVLLRPRFSLANALLWLTPFALVLAGVAGWLGSRRSSSDSAEGGGLTAAEEARVAEITSTVTTPPQSRPTDTTARV